MRVKIGDKVFDSNNEPIAIQIDDRMKEVIRNMPDDNSVFLAYPKGLGFEDMKEWAKELKLKK